MSAAWFTRQNIDLLTRIAAYSIEDSVALGRQCGINFPAQYTVGFKLIEVPDGDGRCTITLRVDATRVIYNDRYVVRMPDRFFIQLHQKAHEVVLRWGDEFLPSREAAHQLAMRAASPVWQNQAAAKAAEEAKKAVFSPVSRVKHTSSDED